MKKGPWLFALVGASVLALAAAGCDDDDNGYMISPDDESAGQPAAKVTPASIEVAPVRRALTNRPGERLTVFVFYAKGAKPGGATSCPDPNTDEAYALLGPRIAASNFVVEYHPAFEPSSVAGQAFAAIGRGFGGWETAVGNSALFDYVAVPGGTAPPQRDNKNVIGWRLFTGRGAASVLAATFIWDDGTNVLEADIFYNLKHSWAVNPSITAGLDLCGTNYDVQAIGTHEIGHMLGLDHVVSDGDGENGVENDATMFGSAAKGELKKQTLTPGDRAGALAVAPGAPAI